MLSLAVDCSEYHFQAYEAGWLGFMHPDALMKYVGEDRIADIPCGFIFEIVKKKIDALVSQGHRFVVPSVRARMAAADSDISGGS